MSVGQARPYAKPIRGASMAVGQAWPWGKPVRTASLSVKQANPYGKHIRGASLLTLTFPRYIFPLFRDLHGLTTTLTRL
jgi:hypothetical protein